MKSPPGTIGYMGIDQHGTHYDNLDLKSPRQDLMNRLGARTAKPMFVDLKSGGSRQVGWVIGKLWVSVYAVSSAW